MVTRFGLDRVLPYKAKPGRSPEARRAAFLEVMDRTAGLAAADPPLAVGECREWSQARAAVDGAGVHRDLNEWEDAVDAVLCAYVAMHRWWHGDGESAVFGDVNDGYIVVPLDDRVRSAVSGEGQAVLSNSEVEQLAVELVTRAARAQGREVEDTRHEAGAVADLVIDGRPVEVKASAGTLRGQDLWLEPRQAEGLRDGATDLVLVEHVRRDGSGTARWVDEDALAALLPRTREQHYYTLAVPVAAYDGLVSEQVPPAS